MLRKIKKEPIIQNMPLKKQTLISFSGNFPKQEQEKKTEH